MSVLKGAKSLAALPLPILAQLRAMLGPQFASTKQEEFFDSKAPELLYSGAMGAGKSRILCEKAWYLAQQYPGATFGIFRKAANSLHATTLRTFERDVMDVSLLRARNRTENWFELKNGSRVYFMGLDPDPVTGVPSKVGSLELAWAGVDEAVELSEGDWIMLLGRLRDPRMPWHQIAAATNPGPPKHWLKVKFTPPDERHHYIHTTARDNRFLPADYLAAIDALPDNAIGRRLGRGEWAAVEGTIWSVNDWQYKVDEGPYRKVIAGIDWGFVHFFACEVLGQTGSGRLHVLDEYAKQGRSPDQAAPELARMAELHGISTFYADPSEPGLMDQLRRAFVEHKKSHRDEHGNNVCQLRATVEPATNDVLPGLSAVDKALRGGMTIDPKCQQLRNEIPGYTWAPQRGGGFQEKPIDVNDDACDALRYAVMAIEPNQDNPWAALGSGQAGGVA